MVDRPEPSGNFTPSPADVAGVLSWFDRYDALALARDFEGMADQAVFPINEVTDTKAEACDRERFIAQMIEQLSGEDAVGMESVRTPHFLNENLAFVITDATITVGEFSQQVRYGDLLMKAGGDWKFQTMVQGGWGDF